MNRPEMIAVSNETMTLLQGVLAVAAAIGLALVCAAGAAASNPILPIAVN